VAWDAPRVSGARTFQRAFNYARYESVWFDVTEGGEYAISTAGERKSSCELYRVLADGLERLTEGNPKGCGMTRRLSPGLYELKITGGTEGIERLRIGMAGRESGETPYRTGCRLRARLEAGFRYALLANRTGRVAARGVVARRLPLAVESPMPIEIPAGETVTIPVAGPGGQLRIVTPGGAPAGCHLAKGGAGQWRDGACWIDLKGPDELGIAGKQDAPLLAWIMRPAAARPAAAAASFRPSTQALPSLAVGASARLDFEPGQAQALVFDVKEAGLYDVGTEGLLATACAVRTPALPQLASDRRGGRGRNCLVSAFLRPGRYLVSVQAEAPSRGRAGVLLTRRPAREVGRLDGEGERFFRAGPGELIRQRVVLPKAGRWELSATALGAQLGCRLEDRDGWPIEQVPGPCRTTQELPAGEVLWTQLPLTVESMRRNAMAAERPPVVLRGNDEVHELAPWRQYPAELGKDGKDEFAFTVPSEGQVSILLTNGMLGRLHREGESEAIELVPPADGGPQTGAVWDGSDESGDGGGESGDGTGDASEGDGTGDASEGDGTGEEYPGEEAPEEGDGEGYAEEAAAEERAPVLRSWRPAPPVVQLGPAPGHAMQLAAGRYRLVTEHGRADVAIAYAIQVSVDPLMPGMERDLPVPSRVPIRVASGGTLRIRTAGEADVRCRLFDADGRRVAESSEMGEDWNCGMAEPVAAGDYRLEIESEMVMPGSTRLSVAQPAPSDVGPLADGRTYRLADGVLSAALPPPAGDAVLEARLEGAGPFSCALEDEAGRVLARSGPDATCSHFLLPGARTWRLRAWTLDRPTEVTARLRTRPVAAFDGGKLPDGGAGRATIGRAGAYRTAEGVRCLAGTSGLLEPCGPEVSLEAGAVVLAAPGPAKLPLEEVVRELGGGEEETVAVGPRPRIQRQRSDKASAHLVAVTGAPGASRIPACRVDGGVHVATERGCWAAAGAGRESVLRLTSKEEGRARVWRAAVTKAKEVELGAGRRLLEVEVGGTLAELPAGPVRAELTLPPRAWALLLREGRAEDLCPPDAAAARCVLEARDGASILLFAPGERRVEAVIASLPAAPAPRELLGLRESVASLPGTERWRFAAAGGPRRLVVEGAAECAIALEDGGRVDGCSAEVPAGVAGTVMVEHGVGPLRLLLAGREDALALAGSVAVAGASKRLPPAEVVALAGAPLDRALELAAESVVHVRADRGVCLLVSGGKTVASGGMGEGCRLDRLLPMGTHRLLVRPFGDAPLSGSAVWTSEPVESLGEGVGPERWLAAGEARLYRFELASRGRVGLGLREDAETLACEVADATGRTLGEGCQQLLELDAGRYLLAVRAPVGRPAARYRPVLLGLAGAETGPPDEYLRELFQRIGGTR
jgi:hypothetical protein